jgi:hypothetical protein
LSHLLDQKNLVLIGRIELIAKTGEEDVEFILVLVGEDGEGSGEPVFGGVARGGGFAFGSFRSGRERCVVLVGGDLGCGSHVFLPA